MNKSTKLNNTDIIKTSKSYEELKFLKEPNIIKTSKSCGELNNREKIDKSDEDEDEDKNYCEICDKKYNIHSWYLKHLNSKLHEKNMKSYNNDRVPVININTNVIKYGKNAPLKSKLQSWLDINKDYRVHCTYKKNDLPFLLELKKQLLNIMNLIDSNIK